MVDAGIILVSDNPLYREGLRCILTARRFNVVGEAPTYQDAWALLQARAVAAELILAGPDTAGRFDLITDTIRHFPGIRIVALSDWLHPPWVERAISSGAVGFLSRDISLESLMQALQRIVNGERLVSMGISRCERPGADLVLRPIPDPPDDNATTPADRAVILPFKPYQDNFADRAPPSQPPAPPLAERLVGETDDVAALSSLSPRERQIAKCLVDGLPNKLIARHLDIAEATVKVHVKSLLRKLNIQNRTQAAILAMRSGFFQGAEAVPGAAAKDPAPPPARNDRNIAMHMPDRALSR